MATKVHDQDDQDFAEIDIILAQAKLALRRDRKLRRNMNLLDIPKDFAHVPSCPSSEAPTRCNTRPVLLATSQPDFASRCNLTTKTQPCNLKLHIVDLMAPVKWLWGYMGCLIANHDDVRSVQQHPPWRRVGCAESA